MVLPIVPPRRELETLRSNWALLSRKRAAASARYGGRKVCQERRERCVREQGGGGVRLNTGGAMAGASSISVRAPSLWRTVVEWVVRVGLVEEVDDAVDDGVDVEDGLPVVAEDVQAHVPLEVDVRVVDLRVRWRREGGGRRRGRRGGKDVSQWGRICAPSPSLTTPTLPRGRTLVSQ